jgi:hypothetical protein
MVRHATAMDLLQEGVERSTIALWLGHESAETTQIYLDANLALRQATLEETTRPEGNPVGIGSMIGCSRSSRVRNASDYLPRFAVPTSRGHHCGGT